MLATTSLALALAQANASSFASGLVVSGYVDTYFGLNFNRPADGVSFAPGTGTSAKRANEVNLNLAAIGLSLAPEPVGFRFIINAGTGAWVVHSGEPLGEAAGPELWRFVQQASVTWQAAKNLQLEVGIYPSHIGLEVLPSKDNWTYTRSWMGEFSPYYQTGVKASYAFTKQLSAQLHFLNGWQVIGDNNRAKSVGAQLAWSTDRLSVTLNGFAGPELPQDNEHWRFFAYLVAVLEVTERLSVGAAVDCGFQQRPALRTAAWQAGGLLGRFAFTETIAIAGRAEVFRDPEGIVSGAGQTLVEGTLTLELRSARALILKLEARHDRSTTAVFSGRQLMPDGSAERVRQQTLVVLGAVASF